MIEIKHLSLTLGDFSLKDVNLTINNGEYLVMLGPTGAGKTVLIEAIAGLHRIRQGEIWIDGTNVTGLAPEERAVGYVPQHFVLFPFLNVEGNIAFGLKPAGYSGAESEQRVATLAKLLNLSHLLQRDTRSLSGGEKQRIALARALAPAPRILLLDEPLSSLDLQTAKYLRMELLRINRELGVTTLHITHNQIEAEEMADRVAVLNLGRLEQVGLTQEVFFYPQSRVVSDFIGSPNTLDCDDCHDLGQGLTEVSCGGMRIVLPYVGGAVRRIAIFPRDIYLSAVKPPGPEVNRYRGTITAINFYGATTRLTVSVGGNTLQAEMPTDIFENMDLSVGKEVYLILKLRRIRILEGKPPRETGA